MATPVYMNVVDCVKGTVMNTGAQKCPLKIEQIIGAILVPKGSYLTAAQMLALKTSIETNTFSSTESTRWFPIQGFVGVEDKSTNTQTETMPYGGMKIGADGKYYWVFRHDGGLTGHSIMYSFHDKQNDYDAYFIDGKIWNKGAIIGTKKNDDGYLYPFDLEMIMVDLYKIGGQNSDNATIGFQLMDSSELNKNISFCPFPPEYRPTSVTGLEHTHLSASTTFVGTNPVVTLQWLGETTNLYDRYSSNLANLMSAWNTSTGLEVTISGVALVPGTKSFTVTISSGTTNLPAAGSYITFKILSADLASESITGVANCELTMVRSS